MSAANQSQHGQLLCETGTIQSEVNMFGHSQRDQKGDLAATESTSHDDATSNAATKSLLLEVESFWNASRGNDTDKHQSRVADIQDGALEKLGSVHRVSKSSQRVFDAQSSERSA